jgi:hypothetical protein
MRPATGLIGIIAFLLGLWTGPFFHIHEVVDPDTHNHLVTLHSHLAEDSLEPDFSGTRIENGFRHDHGTAVTVLAGSGRRTQTVVAVVHSSRVIFDPSILTGFGVDAPVRAHDPPARLSSSPRSPPL